MLTKKYRLKSNSEISQVFKNGKTVKSSFLFLKYEPNNSEQIKIAFSIGLKYSKKAVDRNRAKRVLRTCSEDLIGKIKPGFNLVFFFDKNFNEDLEFKKTLPLMKSCLFNANLLK